MASKTYQNTLECLPRTREDTGSDDSEGNLFIIRPTSSFGRVAAGVNDKLYFRNPYLVPATSRG